MYLSVAGFYLKLKFHNLRDTKSINKLKENIVTYLSGFIIKNHINKPDIEIHFYKKSPLIISTQANRNVRGLVFYERNKDKIITFLHLSIGQFIYLVNRLIHELLIKNKGFMLHASAVEHKGKALIFTGRSGAGKSTAISLLQDEFRPIAEDSVYIRKIDNKYYLYSTPVLERNEVVVKNYKKYKIGKIFFLRKAKDFKIEKINSWEYIYYRLSRQLWTDQYSIKTQMRYFLEFTQIFKGYYFLYFAKNKESLLNLFKMVI